MKEPSKARVKVRRARVEDAPQIYVCQAAAYPELAAGGLCDERQLVMQIETFPDGQLVASRGDRIVGYAMSLIVHLDDESPWFSYGEITGDGTFSTHDPSGDTLYGADMAVHPDHRGRGVAGRLYEGRKKILRRFNLRRMLAGGRLPGYREHAGEMTAEEYVAAVIAGHISDSSLNAHIKAGYQVRGVRMDYLRDAESLNYATRLEFENASFRAERRSIAAAPMRRPVRKVRVCAAQYEVRPVDSWADFEEQVDFFVSTAEQYHCHFLLFPELFTVQLFSMLPHDTAPVQAIEQLADLTERYRSMFVSLAERSGIFIIAGSHPVRGANGITNVAHLFTPSGEIHTQEKLHVTPNERKEYGIRPGQGLKVFDTGLGRIGILVCYDIEFPELARLMTLAGVEILFVPFSTDERKAYLRVRYTAQARAVENIIYCVLAGNVGNLPRVDNWLINYGEAIVCTPSDFQFPPDGIAAKADFNSETVAITDLDLDALYQAREMGSVRPLRDMRTDLYEIVSRGEGVRVIRTS